MIGELLYHLHRHFRLVLLAAGIALIGAVVVFGFGLARHLIQP